MKIGYDLSERTFSRAGVAHGVGRMLAEVGRSERVDGVVVMAPFGTTEGLGDKASWRHVAAHRVWALLPRVWRNLRMPLHLKRNEVDVYHALTGEIPWRMAHSRQLRVVSVDDVDFLVYPPTSGCAARWPSSVSGGER